MNKKTGRQQQKSTLEVLDELRSSTLRKTTSEFGKIGSGILGDLLGGRESNEKYPHKQQEEQKPKKIEAKLFNYAEYHENEVVTTRIKELMNQIRQEIENIKHQESALLNEVRDIQKMTLEEMPEKAGIYHIRFLELVLSILRTVKEKIGDSSTWLAAMMSKKKKRGSAFAVRSKSMGTQYSLSQELQTARGVQ